MNDLPESLQQRFAAVEVVELSSSGNGVNPLEIAKDLADETKQLDTTN
jgi:hypothetical protein